MSKLTDLEIRNWIKAGEHFEQRGDGEGLYLCFPLRFAVPVWKLRYRFAGCARIVTLGSYGHLSLADARKTAKEMRARVTLGYDVAEEKQERKRVAVAKIEARKAEVTMAVLADDYFSAQILGRWKYPNIVRSRIENDIKPAIGKLAIGEIRPTHIDAMLKAIVKRGAPTMANDVLRWVKRMFDYAIKREMINANPATAFDVSDAGGKEESRDRWLTSGELSALFAAMKTAKGWNIQNGLTVKLLLILAVRKGELIQAKVDEFDLEAGVWYLPADRTKTDVAIDIPLPRQAVVYLRELVRLGCGSAWLLPARKMQERMVPHIDLNTVTAAMAKHIKPLMTEADNFTIHDFRRTARTHLAAMGVAPYIAERCLNHAIKGVEGIYNRHDFFDERKDALQKWADLLDEIERGEDKKVVPIRRPKVSAKAG
ncbi:Phage integrase [Candidatus Accumulibacter aalborgensis]|uniref:Phage integrase n=1 Tax=Candidatus Accumulibacter aalborgensis TaxID=1860102 RepID=A0A1A8XSL3_9PROT|nr:site-specific integrase [Candidatus Accumulibacter aalborgensis]SBT08089.1 Phage integrase [Candidatus Accumulibacter aalborgensis]